MLEYNSLKDVGFVVVIFVSKVVEIKINDILVMILFEGERVGFIKVRKIFLIFEYVIKCK